MTDVLLPGVMELGLKPGQTYRKTIYAEGDFAGAAGEGHVRKARTDTVLLTLIVTAGSYNSGTDETPVELYAADTDTVDLTPELAKFDVLLTLISGDKTFLVEGPFHIGDVITQIGVP